MTKIKARLIGLTQPTTEVSAPTAEALVAYCARVSNPDNQDNHETADKLLSYCIRNKHWSVFEIANAVVEVEAPRDITRQLLRHRSFSFQEFSQRYSDQVEFTSREVRLQDHKNRQNSLPMDEDDYYDLVQDWKADVDETLYGRVSGVGVEYLYRHYLEVGVAKECARVILPEGLTMSKLYVNGTLRSWLTYLKVRDDPGVSQWEHVLLAREIKKVLTPAFPKIFGLLPCGEGD